MNVNNRSPRATRMARVTGVAGAGLLALACAASAILAPPAAGSAPLRPAQATPMVTPTPSGGVEADFTDLDLSETDAENFEKRLEDISGGLVSLDSDVERTVLIDAYKELAMYRPTGGAWRAAGPSVVPGNNMPQGKIPTSGKADAFAIDPRDPNVVYAAMGFGGIWKTTDGGKRWRSLTDRQVPMVYGGIEMDPRNPDVLYALLGVFSPSMIREYGYLANGIMRSRDAGRTWKLIGADVFKGASVSALAFDGKGTIYAASGMEMPMKAPPGRPDFGVFKSSNGGDTWERLLSCGDRCTLGGRGSGDLSGGFFDLDVSSDDTVYAVMCAYVCMGTSIYRSTDSGENWDALDYGKVTRALEKEWKGKIVVTDYSNEPAISGLELAVSRTNPRLLLVGGGAYFPGDRDSMAPTSFAMRSRDGGDSWEWLTGAEDYCTANGSNMQCSYDNIVEIDPTDEKIMYLGGSFLREKGSGAWHGVIQRSADGGKTWRDMTPVNAVSSWMHPDAHGFRTDPKDHDVVWVGTDGGIYRTLDASQKQPKWQHMSANINTLLFIGVALHPSDPRYMIGGLQDNAIALTKDGGKSWMGAAQGDLGMTAVDPINPEIVYSTWPQGGFGRNETSGDGGYGDGWYSYIDGLNMGDRWLFYAPFVVDPKNEGVLYFASHRVYKTTDHGDTWKPLSSPLSDRGSIRALAISPSDPRVLYAGTTEGRVWISTNGGARWQKITGKGFPPRIANRIAIDPTDPKIAVVVFGGFNAQTPYAKGHVFRTTDAGKTWENITLNLPDAPIGAAVIDARSRHAGIYIGGSLGMWVLREGSKQWLPYGSGMPYSLITDIQLNPKTGIMAVATYGRSIWVMEMP